MLPSISIIILNWNGWRDTIECLESLYQINYPDYDVILVDNHSKDNSIKKIKEYCVGKINIESKFVEYKNNNKPIKVVEYTKNESNDVNVKREFNSLPSNKKLTIINNDQNYGFAEGNNIGIIYALKNNPSYLLLLNNDTVVNKDFLKELVYYAEKDEKSGIIGSKIYYYDQPTVINSFGGKIRWNLGLGKNLGIGEVDKGQFNDIFEVDCLLGACLLIRSSLLQEIGLMDKNFFLLLEDTDLCVRAKKAGYRILLSPSSIIYHKEGISGEKSPLKTYYFNRNRFIFVKKHLKTFSKYLIILYISSRSFIRAIHSFIQM